MTPSPWEPPFGNGNRQKPFYGNTTADNAKYFTSDSKDSYVCFNTDHLELKAPGAGESIVHVESEAVRWALAEKITTGIDSNTFAPDADCTRAQVVTFLYRLASRLGMAQ